MRQLVPMMTDKGSLARRPLLHLDLPVVVVMAGVGVVEMAGDEVVRMIAVRDGGMAASGAVLVAGGVFAKRDSCKRAQISFWQGPEVGREGRTGTNGRCAKRFPDTSTPRPRFDSKTGPPA